MPVYNDWKSVFKLLENIDVQIKDWDAEVSVLIVNDASTEERSDFNFNLKNYIFTIKWGEQTSTDDREGKIIQRTDNIPTLENIKTTLKQISAVEGQPMHLTHIQYHSYSNEGDRNFSSGASILAESINKNKNIWKLHICKGNIESRKLNDLVKFQPPGGEYWADPFVLTFDNKNFAFFENYEFKN